MLKKPENVEMRPSEDAKGDIVMKCADTKKEEEEEDLCMICYTSELSAEETVKLDCGHEFHLGCVEQLLGHKWNTVRISFSFMQCPACKVEIKA